MLPSATTPDPVAPADPTAAAQAPAAPDPAAELDAELAAFIEAGGTLAALQQAATQVPSDCGTAPAVIIDGASVAVSSALLAFANTVPVSAPAGDADEPLTPPQFQYLTRYLEALAAGKTLTAAQTAEVNGWLERLQKNGYEGSGEKQLQNLDSLLSSLKKIAEKPAPPVGAVLDLYTKLTDAIITGVSKNIKEAEYAKFKQTMDAKPANQSLKDYYEENKGGFAAGLVDQYYIRYQAELLKDKLGKLKK